MKKLPMSVETGEVLGGEGAREHVSPDVAIRNSVISSLGVPPGLLGVTVRSLWENFYRVNVMIGPDPTSVRIAHSYFVEAGDGGRILSTVPPITRLYLS